MVNFIRAFCDRMAIANSEPGTPIRFVASTEGIKRDGKNLLAQDWRIDNYNNSSPSFLWAHDYSSRPLGTARAFLEDSRLMADVTFNQRYDFAREIEMDYRQGFLNAVSVGWDDVMEGNRTVHDLLDISAVPIPADPQALQERQIQGLDQLRSQLEHIFNRSGARPYIIVKNSKGEYCVHKKDAEGHPMGESFGCHPTQADAEEQLKAILVNTHDADRQWWVTIDQMQSICPKCADEMQRKGLDRLEMNAFLEQHRAVGVGGDFPGNMPPQMAEGLCNKIGSSDPGFFSNCMETKLSLPDGWDKKAFCAELHKYCTGIWPSEHDSAAPQGGRSPDAVWNGIASTMLALYHQHTAIEEDTRKALYNLLERAYRKLDRTPPEYRTRRDLIVLCSRDIDGLFLEGEPTIMTRVGAVLSARNRDDLNHAIELIQAVIERAAKEEPTNNEPRVSDDALTRLAKSFGV